MKACQALNVFIGFCKQQVCNPDTFAYILTFIK